MEQFKEIKGFERYAISSHGRVFGVSGQEISQNKGTAYGFAWKYVV